MYILKCILIGASSIGKSTLLLRYLHDKYTAEYQPTIGVDFGEKLINYNDEEYKIQIWDTAGQERFESVTKAFYRNTQCVIYCFSLADRESFIKMKRYVNSFRTMVPENTSVLEILIGLCYDLSPVITEEEIKAFKKDNDIDIYYNISSKNNTNVNKLFKTILENAKDYCVVKEIKQHRYIEPFEVIDPRKEKEQDNDSCCIPYTPHTYPYHYSYHL